MEVVFLAIKTWIFTEIFSYTDFNFTHEGDLK